MKLIADSGSTKTEWFMIGKSQKANSIITRGINPFYQSTKEILQNLNEDFPYYEESIQEVFFYGVACTNYEKNKIIEDVLKDYFKTNYITFGNDLLGAARSLCQHEKGIVSILETSSNSCYYNGKLTKKNVPKLGYIFGDEGSGAAIGKKLIADILKKQLSDTTIELFFDTYKIKLPEILDNVYKSQFPNEYLAQFTKFISNHLEINELEQIVLVCFDEFVKKNLLQYNDIKSIPTYFTGSIAYYFSKQLKKIMQKNNLKIGNITKAPMEGLIKYHNK